MSRYPLALLAGLAVFAVGMSAAPRVAGPTLTQAMRATVADFKARPCYGDADCSARVAAHGLDPFYYEGPAEWLESGCLAKRDATACDYLEAWRDVSPEDFAN